MTDTITNSSVRPNADQIIRAVANLWQQNGWPERERSIAVAYFGSIDRLYDYLVDWRRRIQDIRDALEIRPLSEEIKAEIRAAKTAAIEGDKDPSTPLDLSRRFNLPLEVVLYVADGEPKQDFGQRPWLRRNNRRNS